MTFQQIFCRKFTKVSITTPSWSTRNFVKVSWLMAGCHLCHDSKDFGVARGSLFCAVALICLFCFFYQIVVQEWRASNLTDHVFFLIRFIRPPGIVLYVDQDKIPPRQGLFHCCLGQGRREEEGEEDLALHLFAPAKLRKHYTWAFRFAGIKRCYVTCTCWGNTALAPLLTII